MERSSRRNSSSQVEIPSLDTEGLDKLLIEANELLAKLNLVGDVGCALGEADANRLLDPHHIGEVDPSVWVLDGGESASFPGEWTVLGKEAAQGTAARAAVEPDSDLFLGIGVGGREEPEEQLTSLILVARDRKKTSIALSNVEGHIRQASTVHNELLSAIGQEVVSALLKAVVLEVLVRDSLLDDRLRTLGLRESFLGRVQG